MVWLEDPLTGDVPHRGIIEEEDEKQAQELAPQYTAQPELQWTSGAGPESPIVVFLLGQAACLLVDTLLQPTQVIGSISVPELVQVRSPLEEEYGVVHQPVHTCTLRTPASAVGSPTSSVLVVQCPRELPPEQAVAWSRGLLGALRPAAVVIAGTLPVMSYRGPGSPADEDLVFSLQTSTAAAAAVAVAAAAQAATAAAPASSKSISGSGALPPALPEATLVGGLPAALLTWCELRGMPATLVVGVQMQQVPDAPFLYALGQAAAAALGSSSSSSSEAAAAAALFRQQEPKAQLVAALFRQQEPKAQLVAALTAAADGVYRSSASSSIFS